MLFQNLGQFIEALDQKGWLAKIKTECDPVLEIAEIAVQTVKKEGRALLFENPKGSKIPLAVNLFGAHNRLLLALGVGSYEEVAQRIKEFLTPPSPATLIEKIELLPKLMEINRFLPKKVKKGVCQEIIVENPSLDLLPVLKCWPRDAGKYITFPLVITKDPETGIRNVGCYRMQVHDSKTTGMHWQIHKDATHHFWKYREKKKRMEAAIAIGADPATLFAAVSPLPPGIDELLFSGFLRKSPVEVVKGLTVDLEVPAEAEIVLEGYVDPEEEKLEGPFGDHTGFYSLPEPYPVFHLTGMTHRKNPIYLSAVVGKPPQEDAYFGKAIERIFLPLIQIFYPEICDMNFPVEGVFTNCAIVSIKKSFPGHGKKIIHGLWGLGQIMWTRFIIVVDHTIDIQNLSETAWWVFTTFDPEKNLIISDGPLDALDHASNFEKYGKKLGLDCTKPWREEGRTRPWPEEINQDPEVVEKVKEKIKGLNL
ncbi:MAG: menaquinone biosynthesis decarboxylase [Firmicutes bacterium]|nr:menaquinone biosynthesis decarboxylase [Bacillota bacterium]